MNGLIETTNGIAARHAPGPDVPAHTPVVVPTAVAEAAAAGARPAWLDGGRVPCLDGLRAVSIVLVLVEHASLSAGGGPRDAVRRVLGNVGGVGVDVFFTISGFLITLLLLRERRATGDISVRGFYARRALRLMPAATVFVATVFALQLAGYFHSDGRHWLHVLTYTVNFDPRPDWQTGHLWSLSVEEHFYLLWPLALVVLGARRAHVAPAVWLVAKPLAVGFLLWLHVGHLDRYENWTPFRVDPIAAGCLLALLAQDAGFRRHARVGGRAAGVIGVGVVAAMAASDAVAARVGAYDLTLAHTVRAACVAALIWLTVTHAGGAWGRLLESRPLVVAGWLSYSLYLWQQLFLVRDANRDLSGLLLSLALALIAATLSYALVERPFLRLKGRFRRSRERRPGEPA